MKNMKQVKKFYEKILIFVYIFFVYIYSGKGIVRFLCLFVAILS